MGKACSLALGAMEASEVRCPTSHTKKFISLFRSRRHVFHTLNGKALYFRLQLVNVARHSTTPTHYPRTSKEAMAQLPNLGREMSLESYKRPRVDPEYSRVLGSEERQLGLPQGSTWPSSSSKRKNI